jgi:hypothetical protein
MPERRRRRRRPRSDLADDRQAVGVGVERVPDQGVDGTRAVVLGSVDVVHSGGYRGPEHADGRLAVGRHPSGELTPQLHGAVSRPPHAHTAEREG